MFKPQQEQEFNLELQEDVLTQEGITLIEEEKSSDFHTISRKFAQTRDSLREEIEVLRNKFGLKDKDREIEPLTTQEEIENFKREALLEFGKSSIALQQLENPWHDRTVEESQKLMNDMVRAFDRFYVDMKIVQLHQTGLVVTACDVLVKEENADKVPQHEAEILKNLNMVAAMPSLDDFDDRASEIAKLVNSHTKIAVFANSIVDAQNGLIVMESTASRTISASISQAARGIVQPFNDFVSAAKKEEKISGEFDPKKTEEIIAESSFVNAICENFENAFIIAGAVKDGIVQRGNNTVDYALSAMQTLVDTVAPAVISQGANGLLQVAQYVNSAKMDAQNRNVAGFATFNENAEPTEEEQELRHNIILDIARKLHRTYSYKDENGKSPLDNFSEQGKQKISRLMVEEFITKISDFEFPQLPDLKEKFDRERFTQDQNYRAEMSRKYGVEVEESKAAGNRYMTETISKIEGKIYVDFISDRLIGQVIHGRGIGNTAAKITEIATKVRFDKTDLVPQNQDKTFTFNGLTGSAAIEHNGKIYLAEGRKDEKYGVRAATKEEAELLDRSENKLVGYKFDREIKSVKILPEKQNLSENSSTPEISEIEKDSEKPQDPKVLIDNVHNVALQQIGKHIAEFTDKQSKAIARIDDKNKTLNQQLQGAQNQLQEKTNPKSFFRRIANSVSRLVRYGGKPRDIEAAAKTVKDLENKIERNNQAKEEITKRVDDVKSLSHVFTDAINSKADRRGINLISALDSLRNITNLVATSQQVIDAVQNSKTISWSDAQRKIGFTETVKESFRQGFVIAGALNEGKVNFSDDRVDKVINVAQNITGFVPPVAQQGMALALQVAQAVNSVKKRVNAKTLADFGKEVGESGQEMRPVIMEVMAEKMHDYFSVRSAGKSIIDNFTETGSAKFADALTARMMDQILSYKMPSRDSVEKFDKDQFLFDEMYRSQITQKYGKEIDASDLDNKTIAQINDHIYADKISDQLIGSVLQTRKSGLSVDNFHFDRVDLKDYSENITVEGAIYRPGIISSDGMRFIPQSRDKDVQNANAKYGYRKATPEEEEVIQKNRAQYRDGNISRTEVLPGYVQFSKAQDDFERSKQNALNVLQLKDFAVSANSGSNVEESLLKMAEDYKKAKTLNKDLHHIDFLKDSAVISGESKKVMGMKVGETEERKRFNAVLKKPLLELLSAVDRISFEEIRGNQVQTATPIRSVVDGVKLDSAMPAKDIFAAIKLTKPRDLEVLKGLKDFDEKLDKVDHIAEKVKSAESTKAVAAFSTAISNTIKENVETVTNLFAKDSKEQQTDKKPLISYLQGKEDLVKILDETSVLKILNDTHLTDEVAKKNKDEISQGKSAAVIQKNVVDFIENYHSKVMAGAGLEDLVKFSAENLPIKTDNAIIAAKLVEAAVRNSDLRIAKAEQKQSESQDKIPVTQDVVAEAVNVQKENRFAISSGRVGKEITDREKLISGFQDLVGSEATAVQIGTFKATAVANGAIVEGNKVCLPEMEIAAEGKKPVRLVLIFDPKTHSISDVELHGGDAKGMKSLNNNERRNLFNEDGSVKDSHIQTLKTLMSKCQEVFGDKANQISVPEQIDQKQTVKSEIKSVGKIAKSAVKAFSNPLSFAKKFAKVSSLPQNHSDEGVVR